MTQKLTGDFLPLGSIVRLEETEHDDWLYFIVARAITKGGGDIIVPRYRVAPHPAHVHPVQIGRHVAGHDEGKQAPGHLAVDGCLGRRFAGQRRGRAGGLGGCGK